MILFLSLPWKQLGEKMSADPLSEIDSFRYAARPKTFGYDQRSYLDIFKNSIKSLSGDSVLLLLCN